MLNLKLNPYDIFAKFQTMSYFYRKIIDRAQKRIVGENKAQAILEYAVVLVVMAGGTIVALSYFGETIATRAGGSGAGSLRACY